MGTITRWYSRNWKLTVPGTVLLAVAAVAASIFGFVLLLFSLMKSCDAYRLGLARAQSNRGLQERFGKPIEARWWLSGSISVSGPSGRANIAIPIRGPQAGGTVYVVAHKSAGQWSFDVLEAEVEGSLGRIDLLQPASEGR